jgi:hypothetical protein
MPEPAKHSSDIAIVAGAAYFSLVFAAGFVLGTLRMLLLVPAIGETAAVVLELPLMLALSWIACAFVTGRLLVPVRLLPRLIMGCTAFALLMLAEYGVSALLIGRTLAAHLESYREIQALLGLSGQIVFAAIPALQARR